MSSVLFKCGRPFGARERRGENVTNCCLIDGDDWPKTPRRELAARAAYSKILLLFKEMDEQVWLFRSPWTGIAQALPQYN
jgi:hypothetical protein